MKAGSVTVVLKVDPPAAVWVDNTWKGDRNKIVGLSAGEDHKIVLSAMGFLPKTITFIAQQNETKVITERLVRGDPNAAADSPPDKPAGSGPAKVRVGAKGGFCNVTVNGASYGPTPIEAVVPAGNVRISCKPAGGAAMSQSIRVAPGETGRVSFKIP
jgi:serine/threonine-protein kinase